MKKALAIAVFAAVALVPAASAEAHYSVPYKPGAEEHMALTSCPFISLQPHTDYAAYDIEAWNMDYRKGGFSCRTARRVVRTLLHRGPYGGWHCRHRVGRDDALNHTDYRCRRDHRAITWAVS